MGLFSMFHLFLDRLGFVSQSFYMHHVWLFETLSMSI